MNRRSNQSTCPSRAASAASAFTLIELLVVVAIISLLVSILLPSLKKAKDLAGDTVCMSNLRSITLSMLMYADEYDGAFFNTPCAGHRRTLPGNLVWGDVEWTDWGLLYETKFLTSGEVAYCPRDVLANYDDDWGATVDDPHASHKTGYFSRNWFDESAGFWGVTIHDINGKTTSTIPFISPAESARIPRRSLMADRLRNDQPETWGPHDGRQMAAYTDGSAQPVEFNEIDFNSYTPWYSRLGALFPWVLDERQ